MTTLVECRGRLFANAPHGVQYMDRNDTFIRSVKVSRPIHGCPDLKPIEELELYRWDPYHKSWSVVDHKRGFEIFPAVEVKQ